MKIVAGVQVYLTNNPNEANEFFQKLHICRNCSNFSQTTLFDGVCSGYGDCNPYSPPFNVDYDNCCECFNAREKIVEYWLCKLGQISSEYSGENDELRVFMQKINYNEILK